MVSNMKVALCLHGLFDSTTDSSSLGIYGYAYIKEHILDKFDTDVYIHSWEVDKKDMLVGLYNPKRYLFEPQISFNDMIVDNKLDSLQNPSRPPKSVLSHFYSIQKSFELLYETDIDYDFVIKARFDLGQINRITSPYNVECIDFNVINPQNKLNMAWWPDKWMLKEGPPDVWFYSGYVVMESFTTIYDSISNYMLLNSNFRNVISSTLGEKYISNASVLYKKFLEDNNLWDSRNTLVCKKN